MVVCFAGAWCYECVKNLKLDGGLKTHAYAVVHVAVLCCPPHRCPCGERVDESSPVAPL